MPEKTEEHPEDARAKTEDSGIEAQPKQLSNGESLSTVFRTLAAVFGVSVLVLSKTQQWGYLIIAAFATVLFTVIAENITKTRKHLGIAIGIVVVLGSFICFAIYKIVNSSQPTQENAIVVTTTLTPSLHSTRKSQIPRITTTPEPEPTIHPDALALGVVTGSVQDIEIWRPIQGAIIVAKNNKTGQEYQTASKLDGSFSLTVLVGAYSVTITRDGYIKTTEHCSTSYGSPCGIISNLQKVPK